MTAKAIMILGTGSDVGKSIVAAAFCRIFKRKGFRVSPFKAQNMSNNSYVTEEGGEIGRAQVVQAEAAGELPSIHMNPVLLKPSSEMGSQVVLQGKAFDQMDAKNYHAYKPRLKKTVMESYHHLANKYDLIVIEGAGSCCEMNLKKNDLVNFAMARAANAPCILVADIDRGGVFAQIIGSYHLMTKKEKDLLIGFIINKFRGDPDLFTSGIEYIEKKTGKPVLGLVPFYKDIHIDSEDSVAVQEDKWVTKPIDIQTVNIAVLKLPSISNFTDLQILECESDVIVNFIFHPTDLTADYDMLVMPGTKNVMEDAIWLSRSGWEKSINSFIENGGRLLGICGGYQLMGKQINDPMEIESHHKEVKGLGLLPIVTTLEEEKIVHRVKGTCLINQKQISGYEIHMGRSTALNGQGEPFLKIHKIGDKTWHNDGWTIKDGLIAGTYVHGILDSPGFRGDLLNAIRSAKGLRNRSPSHGRLARFHQYDRLADHFELHCRINDIISLSIEI